MMNQDNEERLLSISKEKVERLQNIEFSDYHFSQLTNSIDTEIADVCNYYWRLPNLYKSLFSESIIKSSANNVLLAFAERMAMECVRKKSSIQIEQGLIALTIINPEYDFRKILMVLSLLYNSTNKLSLDSYLLFQKIVEPIPNKKRKELILRFLEREEEDQRIEAMGYREFTGPSGLVYVFGNRSVPDGFL